MPNTSTSTDIPFLRFIIWYAFLSLVMVGSKFLESPSVNGDGYSYLANILGLALLQPWILWLPGGRLGHGINTPIWFLALSAINFVFLIVVSLAVRWFQRRRITQA